jgi:glycosyltransferase involved in cell wall biosynthesis
VVDHGVWTVEELVQPSEVQLRTRLARKRLLFFGTLRRNKGLHLLLEAATVGQLSGYSITIAGDPYEHEYFHRDILPLVDQARAAGVPVRLRASFVPDDEIGPLFDEHSALVLPYTQEFQAQSGVAFLSLAHGLPLVATAAGGLRQLMAAHRIGEPVIVATAAGVGAAVRRLFEVDSDGVSDLVAGMRSATDRLSWKGMARATLAEYSRVLPPTSGDHRSPEEGNGSVRVTAAQS